MTFWEWCIAVGATMIAVVMAAALFAIMAGYAHAQMPGWALTMMVLGFVVVVAGILGEAIFGRR